MPHPFLTFRRFLVFSGISIILLLLGGIIWIYSFIPFSEIQLLVDDCNISIHETSSGIKYSIQNEANECWVPYEQLNLPFVRAVQAREDWMFWEHNGINKKSIKKALKDHYFKGKKLRGASTLTQQLIKNVFLTKERTFKRKFQEIVIALYLEQHLSKKRIIELYVNVAEFGSNVYGIKNAAQLYFNKKPDQLTMKESLYLVYLLPNPIKNIRSYQLCDVTPVAEGEIKHLFSRISRLPDIDSCRVELAKRQTLWTE